VTDTCKGRYIARMLALLEVAGARTTDEAIARGLRRLTLPELHGLHYRIEQAMADAAREAEAHANERAGNGRSFESDEDEEPYFDGGRISDAAGRL
jgi:hypothetical protein